MYLQRQALLKQKCTEFTGDLLRHLWREYLSSLSNVRAWTHIQTQSCRQHSDTSWTQRRRMQTHAKWAVPLASPRRRVFPASEPREPSFFLPLRGTLDSS
jgi:hypothetical protein